MKLHGITRVRNEAHIIGATLDHVATFCDAVWVFDDASTDDTRQICADHPAVRMVLRGGLWRGGPTARQEMEGIGREMPYEYAMAAGADYIYCFDADERAEIVAPRRDFALDAYALRLFDFYATADDAGGDYTARRWMGPEYRDIPMIFKARPRAWRDRVPKHYMPAPLVGYVKHYGKAISEAEWEATCTYYAEERFPEHPEFRAKWEGRRGKFIHTQSDFGRELIGWDDRCNPEKIVKI